MDKVMAFVLTAILSLSATAVLAQSMPPKEEAKMTSDMTVDKAKKGGMAHKGMMKGMKTHNMMKMHAMMKNVVATSDGGIVVVTGDDIIKYDKDLNLVKEVEMKEGMGGRHMRKMKHMDKDVDDDDKAADAGHHQ